MSIRQLPSGRWRVQIRRKHLRVDRVYDTRAEARDAERRYLNAQKGHSGVSLQDAWLDYVESLTYLQKKSRTRDTEASRIKRSLQRYGKRPVTTITSEDVESYITSRMKEASANSADAIRLEVAALSALMNHCRKRGWISSNPCIGVRRPAATIKPRRMAREDEGALIALLSHSNFRFRSAARLCLLVRETGARPGEWKSATYDDVDLENSRVVFQNTKYRGQPRTVPLSDAAVRLLSDQLQDALIDHFDVFGGSNLLFPALGRDGVVRPLHYTGALRDAKKADLLPKRLRAHTGRHEFISTLLESTDLEDARIMAIVGHHSPTSMEAYKHVRNVRFLPAIEGLEPERRLQRSKALAASLGIPAALLASYLEHRRSQLTELRGEDDGDELLYTRSALEEIQTLVNKLGASPSDRLPALVRVAKAINAARRLQAADGHLRLGQEKDETN